MNIDILIPRFEQALVDVYGAEDPEDLGNMIGLAGQIVQIDKSCAEGYIAAVKSYGHLKGQTESYLDRLQEFSPSDMNGLQLKVVVCSLLYNKTEDTRFLSGAVRAVDNAIGIQGDVGMFFFMKGYPVLLNVEDEATDMLLSEAYNTLGHSGSGCLYSGRSKR